MIASCSGGGGWGFWGREERGKGVKAVQLGCGGGGGKFDVCVCRDGGGEGYSRCCGCPVCLSVMIAREMKSDGRVACVCSGGGGCMALQVLQLSGVSNAGDGDGKN